LLYVEVAETPAQRRRGLMNRSSLADDAGMVFIFFNATTTGFWMKDTSIPLTVAFFGKDGRILRILDMDPCSKEPCHIYYPGLRYWGALEVNQGALGKWDVSVGDTFHLVQ
jgi:uncharacterized membrane protein (UPF0127 family)